VVVAETLIWACGHATERQRHADSAIKSYLDATLLD